MNFKGFIEFVTSNILNYLPDTYSNAQVKTIEVTKNNDTTLTGLQVIPDNATIVSTIYLDDFYQSYKESPTDISSDILDELVKIITTKAPVVDDIERIKDIISDFDKARSYVIPKLINADDNRQYLRDKPHTYFEDMAVVYLIDIDCNYTVPITNQILSQYNVDIKTLHDIALKNQKDSVEFLPMSPIGPFVLTRKDGTNGAALMLNTEILNHVAELFSDNLYIIPSSVDEILLEPESMVNNVNDLASVIPSVNATVVEKTHTLSNNLYHYDRTIDKVTIAVTN